MALKKVLDCSKDSIFFGNSFGLNSGCPSSERICSGVHMPSKISKNIDDSATEILRSSEVNKSCTRIDLCADSDEIWMDWFPAETSSTTSMAGVVEWNRTDTLRLKGKARNNRERDVSMQKEQWWSGNGSIQSKIILWCTSLQFGNVLVSSTENVLVPVKFSSAFCSKTVYLNRGRFLSTVYT